jgi:hypothetical protein
VVGGGEYLVGPDRGVLLPAGGGAAEGGEPAGLAQGISLYIFCLFFEK